MNLKIALGALAAGIAAVGVYQSLNDSAVRERVQLSPMSVTQTSPRVAPSPPAQAASVAQGDTKRMSNPLQLTHDLRDIYERYRDSKNPRERNTAYRAWSACFPAFLSASGGMAPLASLTASLSPSDPVATRRADALRELWGRCKRFSDLPHDKLIAETQRQRDAWMTGRAHSPGDSAAQAHMQGDSGEGLRIARDAVASQDPYAIDSLKDFVIHYWWDLNDTHPDQRIDRPDLRALAFGIAACNMGLECGPSSLTAVQQCAATGACAGDAVDRYMQSLPTQSDRDVVLAESRRVERAVREKDYKGLGLQ
jgi:hypothetical protein